MRALLTSVTMMELAWQHGLLALAPVDKQLGWDRMNSCGRDSWWRTLVQCRPMLLVLGRP